jgi:thiamine pyrophosphate-dependent acetolactate synthase large subunit-like protein
MSDPHCLFTMGLQGRDHVNKAFEKSGTVITVGYDLVEIAPIFWNPDCGTVIDGPGQITAALEEAFAQDGPALIAVPVDYSENQKLTKRLGEIEVAI